MPLAGTEPRFLCLLHPVATTRVPNAGSFLRCKCPYTQTELRILQLITFPILRFSSATLGFVLFFSSLSFHQFIVL